MYKISKVEINGFWQKYDVRSVFDESVNVIIGNNGTGKTTFMNILHAVLAVDVAGIAENEFSNVHVVLSHGKSSRQIRVTKNNDEAYSIITYWVGRKKFNFPLFHSDDIRSGPATYRRRVMNEAISRIKEEMSSLVSLASLSVYRYRAVDSESMERSTQRKFAGPVDLRLQELMQNLTAYQLNLSQRAREISANLQKDVLMSLLYRSNTEKNQVGYALDFDAEKERQAIVSAYEQLGITGVALQRRVSEHVTAVGSTVEKIRKIINKKDDNYDLSVVDFAPLEASKRARMVSDMSLIAESKIDKIFSPVQLFLKQLHEFITDKKFCFESGKLILSGQTEITIQKLSSGEKQLLILLTEALLQREQPFIFLADEPELSLHISWQRQIIPAVRSLNPTAQVIVATHSPEVAGKFLNNIIDMADITNVQS
ncbi:AAA family ATPase [Pseudomonas sp. Irchel s3b6]|uniref:AAA family ATPase n=1 Tax=Pseudomonas sp. Irchel s3b6 TaxID=2009078 RepID=UPI000BA369E5|nr:AAA family ATPase [Pseudomonas sp. Irchel s3b6]